MVEYEKQIEASHSSMRGKYCQVESMRVMRGRFKLNNQIFKYFELNNNPMRVMRGGFEASISPMQVFESRGGSSRLARPCYVSIQISQIFF